MRINKKKKNENKTYVKKVARPDGEEGSDMEGILPFFGILASDLCNSLT